MGQRKEKEKNTSYGKDENESRERIKIIEFEKNAVCDLFAGDREREKVNNTGTIILTFKDYDTS